MRLKCNQHTHEINMFKFQLHLQRQQHQHTQQGQHKQQQPKQQYHQHQQLNRSQSTEQQKRSTPQLHSCDFTDGSEKNISFAQVILLSGLFVQCCVLFYVDKLYLGKVIVDTSLILLKQKYGTAKSSFKI